MNSTILHGDCIEVMQGMPENSVHAIVTDPPYGLGFMGKKWDDLPPGREWAEQCLRVLKPGGHLLAFGGTRTWHRLAVAIEDAGFEMRDSIAWLYGSGFPKSMDVSKAIDKAAGAKREVVGSKLGLPGYHLHAHDSGGAAYGAGLATSTAASRLVSSQITAPATDAARQWEGWGTALKPAFEPIVMARKPLIGTVATNVLEHGTGALNIDATRISTPDKLNGGAYAKVGGRSESASLRAGGGMNVPGKTVGREFEQPSGRWPANVILDESQAAVLDAQSGISKSPPVGSVTKTRPRHSGSMSGGFNHSPEGMENGYGDSGGASRYFFIARKDEECPSLQSSSTVNTAESDSSDEEPPLAFAPSDAATSAPRDTESRTALPSMSDTRNASRLSGPSDMPLTRTTESESLPGSPLESATPVPSLASNAAEGHPIDTMTTTTSRLTFGGSAEGATFDTMQRLKVPGGMASEPCVPFRYVAKAPKRERPVVDGVAHATVKPLTLMRYLVRMVTPPGGVVLEPFAGSGSTVEACLLEGFDCIAIEREAEYLPLIQARVERATEVAA